MSSDIREFLEYGLLPAIYHILFGITLFCAAFFTADFIDMMNDTPAELKQMPWGWEGGGWAYLSKETYIARGQHYAYIGWLNLVAALACYRLGRTYIGYKLFAIAVLAAPIWIAFLNADGME